MSDGTGVGSVQLPASCFFGLVTKSLPPMQFSAPGRMVRQYWVWTPAHGLPPTEPKNELT